MAFDIDEIADNNLRNMILQLHDRRLKDYYRDFVIYHEKIISNFKLCNYPDMPIRKAVTALSKILFHEILGSQADNFYDNRGVDGARFTLSDTSNPSNEIFFFRSGKAYKDVKANIGNHGNYIPKGEIMQIATAIAEKKGFDQNDRKYNIFKSVHESAYSYESNDKEHVSADIDKAQFSLVGRISDYESFVHNALTYFKNDMSIQLEEYLSTSSCLNFEKLKQGEKEENLRKTQVVSGLIERLNDVLESDFRNPLLLIVPPDIDATLSRALCRIPWNMILSFDPESNSTLHILDILRSEWTDKRPFTINNVTTNGHFETAFIFADGEKREDVSANKREWRNKHRNDIQNALKKIRKGENPITVVCFTHPSDNPVYNMGGIGMLSENDDVILIGKIGKNLYEGWVDDFDIGRNHEIESCHFDLNAIEAAPVFNQIDGAILNTDTATISGLTKEDLLRYDEIGIKIIQPIADDTPKELVPLSDFYYGKPITEKDLYNDYDVRREIYGGLFQTIEGRLESNIRFTQYILQTPTSGASTFAMRLAYDIAYNSERGKYGRAIIPIRINEIKINVNSLVRYIKDLSNKLPSSNHILAIIERSISRSDFEDLSQRLIRENAIRISFIRLTSEREKTNQQFTLRLTDELKKGEKVDFEKYYKRINHKTNYEDAKYIIDFPMELDGAQTKYFNIHNYIDSVIETFNLRIQNKVKYFLSLIGFCSNYIINTDNYVEFILFESLFQKKFADWYQGLEKIERKALERLIKFEKLNNKFTGRLTSRFSKFNDILIECDGNLLKDKTIDYINTFFSCKISQDFLENYILNVFFQKEGFETDDTSYSKKKNQEKFSTKLSKIFNQINDFDAIRLIFDILGNYIGDNPRYIIAKAQFLYNRAYFIDGEEHDSMIYEEAKSLLEEVESSTNYDDIAIVLQSLGVLNYRRLGALKTIPQIDEHIISQAKTYLENVLKFCDRAYDSNPTDSHPLVTKAQAIKSFFNLCKQFWGTKDYSFSETKEYIDIVVDFEDTLEKISRYISEVKNINQNTSQLELCEIYAELNEFKLKLQSYGADKIYEIYKERIDSHKTDKKIKTLYANRLYNTLIFNPQEGPRDNINKLKDDQIKFIQEELYKSISNGNLSAYEKIFLIHLYNSREIYNIEIEINNLKSWILKDTNNIQTQLWGNYFIASLYFSKVLLNEKDIEGAKKSAETYISECRKISKRIKRDDTNDFFFFRREKGLRCLTENQNKASLVEGKIIEIKENRQGIVLLDCGLEASFSPKNEFNIGDEHKQTRIRAKVGFRFRGLGLYGVERLNKEKKDDTKGGHLELDYKVPTSHDEKIDVSQHIKNQDYEEGCIEEDYGLDEEYDYPGVYHFKYGRRYVTGYWKETWIKYLPIEGAVNKYVYDEADVMFSVRKKINPDNGQDEWIAYDVKLSE